MSPQEKLYSHNAEACVLASMLIEPKKISRLFTVLSSDSFFYEPHQIIFETLLSMFIDNMGIDGVLFRDELTRKGLLEEVGGVEYLVMMLESVPTSANMLHYAHIVRERQKYRELVEKVGKITKVLDGDCEVDEKIQEIQDIANGIDKSKRGVDCFSMAEHAQAAFDEGEQGGGYIPTGFTAIDSFIEIRPGEFVVIGGDTSMGKSAISLQIAVNMARLGHAIIFFTLEMKHRPLIRRFLRNSTVIEAQALDIVFNEQARTPQQQLAFIKTRKQLHKVDVVFIDYLQLMHVSGKMESRTREVSIISRDLKLMAGSEDVVVVAVCQLNKELTKRENHRPRISDIRESGSIAQDADNVLLLYRPGYYDKTENPEASQDGEAEMIIAKNRDGKTGIARLVFLEEQVTFADRGYGNE